MSTVARANPLLRLARHAIAPLSRTRWFRRVGPRAMPVAERLLHRASRGRLIVSGLLVPSLELRTTGARSGLERTSQLMYTPDGTGAAIVAGTSFARERHPAWSANLLAHPEAVAIVRGRRVAVRASLVPDAQRDAVWARIERQWPGYREYERSAGRQVRLFRLETAVRPSPFDGRLLGRAR